MSSKQSIASAVVAAIALMAGVWFFSDATAPAPIPPVPSPTPATGEVTATDSSQTKLFGYATTVYEKDGKDYVAFDEAQWFSGPDAVKESVKDGQGEPPSGFYIRNSSPATKRYPVAPDVSVLKNDQAIPYAAWRATIAKDGKGGPNGAHVPYWVTLDVNGSITQIREQYVP